MSVKQLLTDNNYNVIVNDLTVKNNLTVNGQILNPNTDFVAPEYYGAVGNGLADDTNAIQLCLNNHENILFGVNKTYRVVSSLLVPSNRYINLNHSSILSNNGINITGTNSWIIEIGGVDDGLLYNNISIFSISGVNNVVIENGNISQGDNGVYIDGSDNVILCNLNVSYCVRGISLYNINSCTFKKLNLNNHRRNSLELNYINYSTFDEIYLYNFGVWGIVSDNVIKCEFSNLIISFDDTYNTFYGGASGGVMNIAYLNKIQVSLRFSDGIKTVEHITYIYGIVDSLFLNCDFLVGNNTKQSKIVNLTNTTFNKCKLNLYNSLPNTTGYGNQFASINFIDCYISYVQINSYTNKVSSTDSTPAGATFILTFDKCQIFGTNNITNMGAGGGDNGNFYDCNIKYLNCEFSLTGSFQMGEQYKGIVYIGDCNFYSTYSQYQALSFKSYLTTTPELTNIYIGRCKFYGGSLYNFYMYTNDFNYSPNITFDNLYFDGSNTSIHNIRSKIKLCNFNYITPSFSEIGGGYELTTGNLNGVCKSINHYSKCSHLGDATTLTATGCTLYIPFLDSLGCDFNYSGFNYPASVLSIGVNNGLNIFKTNSLLTYITDLVNFTNSSNPRNYVFRFLFTPSILLPVGSNPNLLRLTNLTTDVSEIRLYLNDGNKLYLYVLDNTGTSLIGSSFGTFNYTLNQTYEIELNCDFFGGNNRLFIDGVQFGTTKVKTSSLIGSFSLLSFGPGVDNYAFKISKFCLFNVFQHIANYTPSLATTSIPNPLSLISNCKILTRDIDSRGAITATGLIKGSNFTSLTYSMQQSGAWISPLTAVNVIFSRNDSNITLNFPIAQSAIVGFSSGWTFTPAIFPSWRPPRATSFIIPVLINGLNSSGLLIINADGTMTINPLDSLTLTGICGITTGGFLITYNLN